MTPSTHLQAQRHRCLLLACIGLALAQAVGAKQVFGLDFSIGANFTTDTFSDSGFVPSDTMGAVGPDHLALLINGRFSVHDQNGNFLLGKSLNQFWTDAGVTPQGDFAFDPRILYDPHSSRWFAAAVDNKLAPNNILLAVSESENPTDSWTGFQVDSDAANRGWADFPMLGINADVVAVSAKLIGRPGGGGILAVFPKAELLGATPSIANATLQDSRGEHVAVDLDNGPLPLPMIDGKPKIIGELWTGEITGTPEAPTALTGPLVFVPARLLPADVEQPGPVTPIHALDHRFSGSVVLQNGNLWAAHGIGLDGRAAIEWYEFDPTNWNVIQSDVISHASLGLAYPSIAVNDHEDVVIGFSAGDPNTFMGSYAVVGRTQAGVTTFSPITQLKDGQALYDRTDDSGRNRWGDYSATVIDPLNEEHFWTFQQYVIDTDEWAVQVTEIIVPEPSGWNLAVSLCLVLALHDGRFLTR